MSSVTRHRHIKIRRYLIFMSAINGCGLLNYFQRHILRSHCKMVIFLNVFVCSRHSSWVFLKQLVSRLKTLPWIKQHLTTAGTYKTSLIPEHHQWLILKHPLPIINRVSNNDFRTQFNNWRHTKTKENLLSPHLTKINDEQKCLENWI